MFKNWNDFNDTTRIGTTYLSLVYISNAGCPNKFSVLKLIYIFFLTFASILTILTFDNVSAWY